MPQLSVESRLPHLRDAPLLRAYRREPLRFQSVMIIQPGDISADGHQNMCDGCPDMTVWNGKLVWSCRLEEPERFGDFVQMIPRSHESESVLEASGSN